MLSGTSMQTQVIYPALNKMGMWSEVAGELVLGTAIVESNLTYLKQHGEGPALGLWQVEPATHEDLYANYLNYRPEMMSSLMELRFSDYAITASPIHCLKRGTSKLKGLFGRSTITRR